MEEQEFGPLRSRASRKPWSECPDITIYRCRHCGRLYQELCFLEPTVVEAPHCCNESAERLNPISAEELPPNIKVEYKIIGGFNQNAVQVFWETERPEDKPEWVLLKTFSGGYIKYVTPKKRPPVIFPMSDEDAYVYCDRKVCEQCVFRCKRGFSIYLYLSTVGLMEIPLDKMSDYFKLKQ